MKSKKMLGVVLVAVAAVALIVVVAVVLHGSNNSSEGQGDAESSDQSAGAPAVPPPAEGRVSADPLGRQVTEVASEAGAPLPQTGQPGGFPTDTDKVGPPSGLALQRVASGGTVMVSSSDGPTGTQGPVLTGYAHSARGAGLLTADYGMRGLAHGDSQREFLRYYAADVVKDDPAALDGLDAKGSPEQVRSYLLTGYSAPRWVRFKGCDERFCTVEMASASIREAVGEINTNTNVDSHGVLRASWKWSGDRWELVDAGSQEVREIDDSWEKWL